MSDGSIRPASGAIGGRGITRGRGEGGITQHRVRSDQRRLLRIADLHWHCHFAEYTQIAAGVDRTCKARICPQLVDGPIDRITLGDPTQIDGQRATEKNAMAG